MDDPPDRTLPKYRPDPKALREIVDILSRDGRRAIVKLDDRKLDDLTTVTPAALSGAKDIDVSSYWTNPDHPSWGRRHYVYVMAGPAGTQYFGDSTSDEVTTVLKALDAYFGPIAPAAASPPPRPATRGRTVAATGSPLLVDDDGRTIVILIGIAVLIALISFFLGRWSVDRTPIELTPPMTFSAEAPLDATPSDPALNTAPSGAAPDVVAPATMP